MERHYDEEIFDQGDEGVNPFAQQGENWGGRLTSDDQIDAALCADYGLEIRLKKDLEGLVEDDPVSDPCSDPYLDPDPQFN